MSFTAISAGRAIAVRRRGEEPETVKGFSTRGPAKPASLRRVGKAHVARLGIFRRSLGLLLLGLVLGVFGGARCPLRREPCPAAPSSGPGPAPDFGSIITLMRIEA